MAIENAAWEVLGRRGYDGMTFEAVAELAGCSRSTMYRRFRSKLDVVNAILHASSRGLEGDAVAAGEPRDMLISYLTHSALSLVGPRRQAILSLLESGSRVPELGEVMEGFMTEQKEEYFFKQFQRMSSRPLDPSFADFLYDSLAGAVLYNLTVRGRTLNRALLGMLADQALMLASSEDAAENFRQTKGARPAPQTNCET